MGLEIEAKFMDADHAACREALLQNGFACTKPLTLMRRRTFTLTELAPSPHKWARVRDEGDKVTLAVKHMDSTQGIHGQHEVEAQLNSWEDGLAMMRMLGFEASLYQESRRETWHKDDVQVTLDEWPQLPPFVEIEAASEAVVQATAKQLGFDYAQAVFAGVGRLYALQTNLALDNIPSLTFSN